MSSPEISNTRLAAGLPTVAPSLNNNISPESLHLPKPSEYQSSYQWKLPLVQVVQKPERTKTEYQREFTWKKESSQLTSSPIPTPTPTPIPPADISRPPSSAQVNVNTRVETPSKTPEPPRIIDETFPLASSSSSKPPLIPPLPSIERTNDILEKHQGKLVAEPEDFGIAVERFMQKTAGIVTQKNRNDTWKGSLRKENERKESILAASLDSETKKIIALEANRLSKKSRSYSMYSLRDQLKTAEAAHELATPMKSEYNREFVNWNEYGHAIREDHIKRKEEVKLRRSGSWSSPILPEPLRWLETLNLEKKEATFSTKLQPTITDAKSLRGPYLPSNRQILERPVTSAEIRDYNRDCQFDEFRTDSKSNTRTDKEKSYQYSSKTLDPRYESIDYRNFPVEDASRTADIEYRKRDNYHENRPRDQLINDDRNIRHDRDHENKRRDFDYEDHNFLSNGRRKPDYKLLHEQTSETRRNQNYDDRHTDRGYEGRQPEKFYDDRHDEKYLDGRYRDRNYEERKNDKVYNVHRDEQIHYDELRSSKFQEDRKLEKAYDDRTRDYYYADSRREHDYDPRYRNRVSQLIEQDRYSERSQSGSDPDRYSDRGSQFGDHERYSNHSRNTSYSSQASSLHKGMSSELPNNHRSDSPMFSPSYLENSRARFSVSSTSSVSTPSLPSTPKEYDPQWRKPLGSFSDLNIHQEDLYSTTTTYAKSSMIPPQKTWNTNDRDRHQSPSRNGFYDDDDNNNNNNNNNNDDELQTDIKGRSSSKRHSYPIQTPLENLSNRTNQRGKQMYVAPGRSPLACDPRSFISSPSPSLNQDNYRRHHQHGSSNSSRPDSRATSVSSHGTSIEEESVILTDILRAADTGLMKSLNAQMNVFKKGPVEVTPKVGTLLMKNDKAATKKTNTSKTTAAKTGKEKSIATTKTAKASTTTMRPSLRAAGLPKPGVPLKKPLQTNTKNPLVKNSDPSRKGHRSTLSASSASSISGFDLNPRPSPTSFSEAREALNKARLQVEQMLELVGNGNFDI